MQKSALCWWCWYDKHRAINIRKKEKYPELISSSTLLLAHSLNKNLLHTCLFTFLPEKLVELTLSLCARQQQPAFFQMFPSSGPLATLHRFSAQGLNSWPLCTWSAFQLLPLSGSFFFSYWTIVKICMKLVERVITKIFNQSLFLFKLYFNLIYIHNTLLNWKTLPQIFTNSQNQIFQNKGDWSINF